MDDVPDAYYVCLNTIVDTNNPDILQDREANVSISTNGKVLNGVDIDYHAGQIVELLNEFEVEIGAEFEVYIASCN